MTRSTSVGFSSCILNLPGFDSSCITLPRSDRSRTIAWLIPPPAPMAIHFFLLRQRLLQYLTSSQCLAHFFRHAKARPHALQVFSGRPCLLFFESDIVCKSAVIRYSERHSSVRIVAGNMHEEYRIVETCFLTLRWSAKVLATRIG